MKLFLIIFIFIFTNCSFDTKTGIWKNENNPKIKKESKFKDFKTIYVRQKTFDQIIEPPSKLIIEMNKVKKNFKWEEEFYNKTNNLENFSYTNSNEITFKSKKITRKGVNDKIFFDGKNIILSDTKGTIIAYSLEKKKILYEYNFYKKRYKKFKKKLQIIIENNIIYVADNIGYFYAISYIDNKLLWAKDYKVPFRSNLKIYKDKIVLSDQNNSIYVINKFNGETLKKIPTEEVTLKNEFINSLALQDNVLIFLNTFGTIYSLNLDNLQINWFLNLNKSPDLNLNNLFNSNPISIKNNKILIPTDINLYVLDLNSGSTLSKAPISTNIKPILTGKGLFLITKNNLLIFKDLENHKIVYSIDLDQKIAQFLNTKKSSIRIKNFYLVNSQLFIFLENSYLIKLNFKGKIIQINKLPSKLGSLPIFIDNSILYLNKKANLIMLN